MVLNVPAAMDGGAGVFAFSIADKQIFIALVDDTISS